MATTYYENSIDLDTIRSRRVAIIGYGNQGRAHALNLRDSGCTVRVGARPGRRAWKSAETDGFSVDAISDACTWADVICVLLPDQVHRQVFDEDIRAHVSSGDVLLFAHGFSIHYGLIVPPDNVDVVLVAPVGPGALLRRLFLEGHGIPAVFAVQQTVTGGADNVALSYAGALGCGRAGVLSTTFAEETETDLFGEQAILCGGLTALIKAGFKTLVQAGYQPDMAFFECMHQVKLIVDLIYEGGLVAMHQAISDTAEYGDRVTGPRIIDAHVEESMRAVLHDIQNGVFARAWVEEYETGMANLTRMRREEQQLEIEQVGNRLRSLMSWIESERTE